MVEEKIVEFNTTPPADKGAKISTGSRANRGRRTRTQFPVGPAPLQVER